jgi:hypothetical protein
MYIQGNYKGFWIFAKNILLLLHKTGRYQPHKLPTISKFYLPVEDADKYCAAKYSFV